jgi:hypothetical protein
VPSSNGRNVASMRTPSCANTRMLPVPPGWGPRDYSLAPLAFLRRTRSTGAKGRRRRWRR